MPSTRKLTDRQQRALWFRERAGWCVGEKLLGAFALADAEIEAESLGWLVEWYPEDENPFDSWDCSERQRKEAERCFESGQWTYEWAKVVLASGRYFDEGASLGGIFITEDEDYRRVVEAELFLQTLRALERNTPPDLGRQPAD